MSKVEVSTFPISVKASSSSMVRCSLVCNMSERLKDNFNAPAIILASASPRRQALLASAGIALRVDPPRVDEALLPGEAPAAAAERLAQAKAAEVFGRNPGDLVLAADTLVALGAEILGKPASAEEAVAMLERLSGETHAVVTGVALLGPGVEARFHARTEVEFRPLSAEEIRAYVRSGEPLDKAGAYGIQGGAAAFVRTIRGSYTNVVGLPLAECVERLRRLGR